MDGYDQAPAGHKKKRTYAPQAYEFGANVQQPAQAAPPSMGAPMMAATPMMQGGPLSSGQPMSPGAPQDQLGTQFGQMNLQSQPQPQAPQPVQQQAGHINQLFPSDL